MCNNHNCAKKSKQAADATDVPQSIKKLSCHLEHVTSQVHQSALLTCDQQPVEFSTLTYTSQLHADLVHDYLLFCLYRKDGILNPYIKLWKLWKHWTTLPSNNNNKKKKKNLRHFGSEDGRDHILQQTEISLRT